MRTDELEFNEIACGYRYDANRKIYECVVCGKTFDDNEVYPMDGRFLKAARAVEVHMEAEHGDYLDGLINNDSRYNTMTDNQKQLLKLFSGGLSDQEIAKELGLSVSTIRQQRFVFREKAKQAKFYLGVYSRVFERESPESDRLVPVHEHSTVIDERVVVTEEEKEKILKTYCLSTNPLKIKLFPPKEKKKLVLLSKIAECFDSGKEYSEKEVNGMLGEIYQDFATLRRYLIEYGFMERTRDCSKYWVK